MSTTDDMPPITIEEAEEELHIPWRPGHISVHEYSKGFPEWIPLENPELASAGFFRDFVFDPKIMPVFPQEEQEHLEAALHNGHRYQSQPSVEGEFLYEPAIQEAWKNVNDNEPKLSFPWLTFTIHLCAMVIVMWVLSYILIPGEQVTPVMDPVDFDDMINVTILPGNLSVDGMYDQGKPKEAGERKMKTKDEDVYFKEYRDEYDKNLALLPEYNVEL